MKKIILILSVALMSVAAFAQTTNSAPAATDQVEAKYTRAIEGRTADILKVLNLSDSNKVVAVHDIVIAQYRALNAWHSENDAKLKAARSDTNVVAQIHASLITLHNDFLSKLAENLTPEQIEQVKDKMTYGKVQFTFAGYVSQYPNLSDENKKEILRLLKEAREQAMDGGSAAEKTAIFQRYKGKINNYLSKQNLHLEKTTAQ
jgi:hypothetical protein